VRCVQLAGRGSGEFACRHRVKSCIIRTAPGTVYEKWRKSGGGGLDMLLGVHVGYSRHFVS